MGFVGVEAVFFDLDDTLVDARGSWHAGFAEVTDPLRESSPEFAALGSSGEIYEGQLRPLIIAAQLAAGSSEWSNEYARHGFRQLLGLTSGLSDPESDAIFEAYLEAWPRHLRLFDDVLPALETLRERYCLGLISNGLGREQRIKLDRLELHHYFAACVISEAIRITKTQAGIFAHALDALGVTADVALHAGDNPCHDVAGARDHGMRGVWVNRRGGRFDGPGEADAEVTDLGELVQLLEG